MNPCNQSSRAVSASSRRSFVLLLTGSIVVALALTSLMAAPNAQAWTNINQQANKLCKKKKKAKAKRACLKKQRARLTAASMGVMTRNLYLGADLDPGLNASSYEELADGAGEILRTVDATKPALRMRVLAKEIRSAGADIVGLQEVALWRQNTESPALFVPGPDKTPTAKDVRYDYLALLLKALNSGQPKSQHFRTAVVKDQFDFETGVDFDESNETCREGWEGYCSFFPGADLIGRLTMRDAIIVKAGVKISNPASGTYGDRNGDGDVYDLGDVPENLHTPKIAGSVDVPVTRGWTAVTASVRGSKKFRFVNTHLEAFGDDKNKVVDCMGRLDGFTPPNPVSLRCRQAKELHDLVIRPSDLPVILVGDLNSDDDTVVDANCPAANNPGTPGNSLLGNNGGVCGDTFAYNSLITNGMRSLTYGVDNSCCGGGTRLDDPSPKELAKFDHHIDHILTDSARRFVRIGASRSTGTKPFRTPTQSKVGPYFGSDHGGVAQRLRIR